MGEGFHQKTWLIQLAVILLLAPSIIIVGNGAVVPPPWANPKLNPCATQPRGWQLLYWPPDGKCYKIFQLGYPCPEGMELSPIPNKYGEEKLSAECRCPPKTAQSATNGQCYKLFTQGPCDSGSYFAPDTVYNSKYNGTSKREWGVCKQIKTCPDPTWLYWPKNGMCYERFTRGPCSRGQLITDSVDSKIATCTCTNHQKFEDYRHSDNQCYQHFTRGPCWEKGHLFLPNRKCGCYSFLPHYHADTQKCFELGSIGPCTFGEVFELDPATRQAMCHCKPGYIRYANHSSCHRPFTQGPCDSNEFLLNTTTCLKQPCSRGHLYFPSDNSCYRIGTRGPCPQGRVVTFDFETRPSLDGISYNGRCMCEQGGCISPPVLKCDKSKGFIKYRNACHKLYSQGPCPHGSWLVPMRHKKSSHELQSLWDSGQNYEDERMAMCECKPNYTKNVRTLRQRNVTICMPPSVILADYLNRNHSVTVHVTQILNH